MNKLQRIPRGLCPSRVLNNMGEVKFQTCTTVAIRYRFVIKETASDGSAEICYEPEPLRKIEIEEVAADESNEPADDSEFEDDVDFLRSLDPKEWKNQDHYAVLGIKKLRHKATDDDIKKAYRKMVLKHHPDKRKALGEEIRPDDDYFTCITKAYEILGVPNKRRSYDSVDPFFDDSVPSNSESKKDFFEIFPRYFKLNARWSEKKPVPLLGGPDTSRENVEKFYSFWYNFESWREFSYLDEEEKEKGQDREERRWIEKQNKVARAKRKKEEMQRIRSLVDAAYNADPRIIKFKQEEKDRKLAAKRAKQSAAQARKEEEERLQKEAKLAQEKAEAEERAKQEARKQEKDNQKKALKRERKIFRDSCKANNYYCVNEDEHLTHMTAIEKMCEILKLEELEKLNNDMKDNGRKSFIEAMNEVDRQLEEERIAHLESQKKADKTKTYKVAAEWTEDHLQLLIKAVNLFPAGTNQRWEVVANFINQHGTFGDTALFTAKEVLAKAKDLQNTDFSKSNLKVAANKQAYSNFEKDKQNARVIDNTQISEKIDPVNTITIKKVAVSGKNDGNETNGQDKNGTKPKPEVNGVVKTDAPWTPTEQQLLEQALKTYTNATPDRWDKIADCIPTRNKKECMRRYKELVEIVKAKKAAQAAVKTK